MSRHECKLDEKLVAKKKKKKRKAGKEKKNIIDSATIQIKKIWKFELAISSVWESDAISFLKVSEYGKKLHGHHQSVLRVFHLLLLSISPEPSSLISGQDPLNGEIRNPKLECVWTREGRRRREGSGNFSMWGALDENAEVKFGSMTKRENLDSPLERLF